MTIIMPILLSKRRKELIEKVQEMARTWDAQVDPSSDAIIEPSSTDPDTLQDQENSPLDLYFEQECERLTKALDEIKLIHSQLLGKELQNLSTEQLNQLAEKIQNGLSRIKAEKENRHNIEKTKARLQHAMVHLLGDKNVANQERGSPDLVLPRADNHGEDIVDLSLRLGRTEMRLKFAMRQQ